MAGQSNSDGRGAVNEVPAFPYAHKVKVYKHAGVWGDGSEPIGDETNAVYSALTEGVVGASSGMSFGNALYQLRPNREIGLVPCGRGSTSIADWQPDPSTSTLYGATVARALAAEPAGIIKGLIWYQGEAEASDESAAENWAASFLTIYDSLCEDLGIPDLKCIVTEMGPVDLPDIRPYWSVVQAQQRSLDGQRSGNIACVSAADLSVKVGDEIHLDTEAQVTLGERYAAAMADLLA